MRCSERAYAHARLWLNLSPEGSIRPRPLASYTTSRDANSTDPGCGTARRKRGLRAATSRSRSFGPRVSEWPERIRGHEAASVALQVLVSSIRPSLKERSLHPNFIAVLGCNKTQLTYKMNLMHTRQFGPTSAEFLIVQLFAIYLARECQSGSRDFLGADGRRRNVAAGDARRG